MLEEYIASLRSRNGLEPGFFVAQTLNIQLCLTPTEEIAFHRSTQPAWVEIFHESRLLVTRLAGVAQTTNSFRILSLH